MMRRLAVLSTPAASIINPASWTLVALCRSRAASGSSGGKKGDNDDLIASMFGRSSSDSKARRESTQPSVPIPQPRQRQSGVNTTGKPRRIVETAFQGEDAPSEDAVFAVQPAAGRDDTPSIVSDVDQLAKAEAAGHTVQLHELLDDDATYFPPLPQPKPVPGQQLVAPGMARYRFEVQYRGDSFQGWSFSSKRQSQWTKGGRSGSDLTEVKRRTAEEAFREALAVAMDLDGVQLNPSVLPEVGCHCRRLSCHVDVPLSVGLQPRTILQRAHAWLHKRGDKGGILTFARAKDDFLARHSAVQRVYVYRILNRIAPPLMDQGLQWHVDRYLDEDKMAAAAKLLEGTHDFGAFADNKIGRTIAMREHHYLPRSELLWDKKHGGLSRSDPESTTPLYKKDAYTVRTIDRIQVVRQEDEIQIWFVGKSFLRRQIRHMVSVLKLFGQGLWTERDLRRFMDKGFDSRAIAYQDKPAPAPAHGLTLWEAVYPAHSPAEASLDSGPLEHRAWDEAGDEEGGESVPELLEQHSSVPQAGHTDQQERPSPSLEPSRASLEELEGVEMLRGLGLGSASFTQQQPPNAAPIQGPTAEGSSEEGPELEKYDEDLMMEMLMTKR